MDGDEIGLSSSISERGANRLKFNVVKVQVSVDDMIVLLFVTAEPSPRAHCIRYERAY